MIRLLGVLLFAAAAFSAQWSAPSDLPGAQEAPRVTLVEGTSGSSVRAGRMVEARADHARMSGHEAERSSAVQTGPAPSPTGLARTNEQLVAAAAAEFGADAGELARVAMCESTWNVDAVGAAQEVGLYQWLPQTWAWLGRISGLGYTVRDIGDVRAQARLTAWAFANGYAHHWTCAR